MGSRNLTLSQTVALLRRHYGPPEPPPTRDPFELILYENVAYLAPPARRREAFALLREKIGTDPERLLAAPRPALESITRLGILKGSFAAKLRECARILLERFDGSLEAVVRQPAADAVRALRAFPGIGEPGAEKVLLFSGKQPLLAPDSNALRVLVRLGMIREGKNYARTYAAAKPVAATLPQTPRALQQAHLLLQLHGQTLCKRSKPRCDVCPLSAGCAFYLRG